MLPSMKFINAPGWTGTVHIHDQNMLPLRAKRTGHILAPVPPCTPLLLRILSPPSALLRFAIYGGSSNTHDYILDKVTESKEHTLRLGVQKTHGKSHPNANYKEGLSCINLILLIPPWCSP